MSSNKLVSPRDNVFPSGTCLVYRAHRSPMVLRKQTTYPHDQIDLNVSTHHIRRRCVSRRHLFCLSGSQESCRRPFLVYQAGKGAQTGDIPAWPDPLDSLRCPPTHHVSTFCSIKELCVIGSDTIFIDRGLETVIPQAIVSLDRYLLSKSSSKTWEFYRKLILPTLERDEVAGAESRMAGTNFPTMRGKRKWLGQFTFHFRGRENGTTTVDSRLLSSTSKQRAG